MVVWTVLSWIMSPVALAGTVLNAERNVYGFVFWLISNMYMTIRFTYIGEYAQAVLFLIYTILAVRGIIAWTKKERQFKTIKVDALKVLEKVRQQIDLERENKK